MADLRFDGRVAIVTGSGRGLGRAYAELLAQRGAAVVVNDLGCTTHGIGEAASVAEEVAAGIRAAGGRAIANSASVSSQEGARSIVEDAVRSFHRIDILINNAGIQKAQPFEETPIDEFRRHMDVHVFGTVMVTQAAWPHLKQSDAGRIVNTISGAMYGLAGYSAYNAAKGALFALTRTLALEGVADGIRVNAVSPSAATRLLQAAMLDQAIVDALAKSHAPALVAPMVAWLAHESCMLNGEAFTAAGGKIARWRLGEGAIHGGAGLVLEEVPEIVKAILAEDAFTPFANTMENLAAMEQK